MSYIAAVAYNSCTGEFLRACYRHYPPGEPLTAKCWAIGAISIIAVPILSTVDAAISLTMCALIIPLVYWKGAPFIDFVASLASIITSVFLLVNLCGIRNLRPVGQRNFISGTACGLIEEGKRKESGGGPPAEHDVGLKKLRQFAKKATTDSHQAKLLKRKGVFKDIPDTLSNKSPAAFCDYLEMAIQKGVYFGSPTFDGTQLPESIFTAGIRRKSWDQESANRFIKIMSIMGLSMGSYFDLLAKENTSTGATEEDIQQILQVLLKQPGSISSDGEFVNPFQSVLELYGTQFFEDLQKLGTDSLSPKTILYYAHEFYDLSCSYLSRVVNFRESTLLALILKQKASPNATDPFGRSLLTVLITGTSRAGRRFETSNNMLLKLLLLLEYGADLKKNWLGHTLFDWADYCSGHDEEINGKVILDQVYQCLNGFRATASLEQVVHSINVAIRHSYPNVIKRLIPNLRRCLEVVSSKERLACESKLLLAAIRCKNVSCVEALLDNQVGVDCMVTSANKEIGSTTSTDIVLLSFPPEVSMPENEAFEAPEMMQVLKKHSGFIRDAIHKELEADGAAFPNTVTTLIQEYWRWG